MSLTPTTRLTSTGLSTDSLGLYLNTMPTIDHLEIASSSSFVVLKGEKGARLAGQIRDETQVPIILDPCGYEPKRRAPLDDHWRDRQTMANVAQYVSLGVYLHQLNRDQWLGLVTAEANWCRTMMPSQASVAVAIHTDSLISHHGELAAILAGTGLPVWLTLANSNDPLSKLRSVAALVNLLDTVPDISLMRTDVAALGAAACGARLVSIGATTTVRHVSTGGGGSIQSNEPTVFVEELLDWKKPTKLLGWVQREPDVERELVCSRSCCEGESVLRFRDPAEYGGITKHNLTSLRELHGEIVAVGDLSKRRDKFFSMAGHAIYQSEFLADTIPGVKPSQQIRQWAALRQR